MTNRREKWSRLPRAVFVMIIPVVLPWSAIRTSHNFGRLYGIAQDRDTEKGVRSDQE